MAYDVCAGACLASKPDRLRWQRPKRDRPARTGPSLWPGGWLPSIVASCWRRRLAGNQTSGVFYALRATRMKRRCSQVRSQSGGAAMRRCARRIPR